MEVKELISLAIEVMDYSYSPYSNFKVGACLLTKDGRTFKGANIENSSYGLSMCAERNATFHAYCSGVKKEEIEAICIVAKCNRPVSPCGACRQVLSELLPTDAKIILANTDYQYFETTIEKLLPYYFTKDDMK